MNIEPLNSDKLDSDFSGINGYYGENQMMNWFAPPTAIKNVNGVVYESTPYGVPMDEPVWFKTRRNYLRDARESRRRIDIIPTALPSGDRLEDYFSNFTQNEISQFLATTDEASANKFYNLVCDTDFGVDGQFSNGIGSWVKQTVKDAGKSISDAGKTIQDKGIGGALKDLGKEAEKLGKEATLNIKQTTQDALKNIKSTTQDAINSVKSSVQDVKNYIGDKLGGGVGLHAVNKYNPVMIGARGATISLIELNVVGLATAMLGVKNKSNKRWEELLQKWWMLGGEKKRFDEAVETGQRKKKLFLDLVEKAKGKKGFNGEFSYAEGDKEINPAKMVLISSSALGSVSGVLLAIPEPTTTTKAVATWTGLGSAVLGSMGGVLKAFAKDEGASDKEVSEIPQQELPPPAVPQKDEELAKIKAEIDLLDKAGVQNNGYTADGKEVKGLTKAEADAITISMGGKVEDVSTSRLSADADKILGMPKNVFYIGLGVVALVGGYLIYRKYKK